MQIYKKYKMFFIFLLSIASFFIIASPYVNANLNEVQVVKIEDYTINPITADYIINSIDRASREGAECLIIELDTPGGLLTSTRLIVKSLMSADIPVVVYVYPSGSRAGSAGVFITYASHIAAMAPSTNIGAAHPVEMGSGGRRSVWDALRDLIDSFLGRDKQSEEKAGQTKKENPKDSDEIDIMSNKILNDTVAFIEALANERNRNVKWAVKSVTQSAAITEKDALKNNVIEIVAKDERDLLAQLDGREVKIGDETKILNVKNARLKYEDMNFRQRFLNVLANPNLVYILLLLGFYGLLFEITHPGIGFPGVAGAICIILAFFSMQTLPTNYAGLALIILGIVLFIAEAKAPGLGLLTLGGVVCMILGSLLLFESPEEIMRVSLTLIMAFTIATAGITLVLVRVVFVSHKRKAVSGREGLVGARGVAWTKISPGNEGKVFVHGEIWNAISGENINKGAKVKVMKLEGMIVEVKRD